MLLKSMPSGPAGLASAAAVVAIVSLSSTPVAEAQEKLAFSGGPDGGTFQYFSNGIASRLSRNLEIVEASNMASSGSVENLRRVNSGDADFGITYSGDLYLGSQGKLANDEREYRNVYAVSYLYGAPAHLIVLEGAGVHDVSQLEGKRVAVGPAGSGAATSAQRFFESVGLWDKIQPEYIGYSRGVSALGKRQVDALWVFAGFPNASVIQAASNNSIHLLQVYAAAEQGALFDEHPYYAEATIPAGTYPGVDYDVKTLQDAALWVAGRHLDEALVYDAVSEVYSEKGLNFMHAFSKAAEAMSVDSGLNGIVNTVHPGAARFWKEQGLELSEEQQR